MKTFKFPVRIMENMKSFDFITIFKKIIKIIKILCGNYENHENHIVSLENHENHEILKL